ncbi:hypothetical protein CECT5772_01266 [Streptococcus equi subsp. ruminatorum CECT 5772]|uniref:Uncharacterized protein n=1 Tax=Streptococcus equi subsp. ruminatorum CECT 5772 TaxID=1051981 RepID=A0A922NX46_9STRE|nr:hypothetical protein CECT5772_01266 [Streptococcus equi subsp. ruminatorum CECT 5772]
MLIGDLGDDGLCLNQGSLFGLSSDFFYVLLSGWIRPAPCLRKAVFNAYESGKWCDWLAVTSLLLLLGLALYEKKRKIFILSVIFVTIGL